LLLHTTHHCTPLADRWHRPHFNTPCHAGLAGALAPCACRPPALSATIAAGASSAWPACPCPRWGGDARGGRAGVGRGLHAAQRHHTCTSAPALQSGALIMGGGNSALTLAAAVPPLPLTLRGPPQPRYCSTFLCLAWMPRTPRPSPTTRPLRLASSGSTPRQRGPRAPPPARVGAGTAAGRCSSARTERRVRRRGQAAGGVLWRRRVGATTTTTMTLQTTGGRRRRRRRRGDTATMALLRLPQPLLPQLRLRRARQLRAKGRQTQQRFLLAGAAAPPALPLAPARAPLHRRPQTRGCSSTPTPSRGEPCAPSRPARTHLAIKTPAPWPRRGPSWLLRAPWLRLRRQQQWAHGGRGAAAARQGGGRGPARSGHARLLGCSGGRSGAPRLRAPPGRPRHGRVLVPTPLKPRFISPHGRRWRRRLWSPVRSQGVSAKSHTHRGSVRPLCHPCRLRPYLGRRHRLRRPRVCGDGAALPRPAGRRVARALAAHPRLCPHLCPRSHGRRSLPQ